MRRSTTNFSFDLMRDIVPIASITRSPGVLEVNPSFPAQTVPEFIAYAKANPGKINMASAGPGSAPHLYTELFKMLTGVDVVQVHYRGSGPALPDLIAGQVHARESRFGVCCDFKVLAVAEMSQLTTSA